MKAQGSNPKAQDRRAAIAAEVEALRETGYGRSWVTRHNGRVLALAELAAINVDRKPEFDAKRKAMVDARRAPGSQTDREFFAGLDLNKQYGKDPIKLAEIQAGAKRHGYTPQGDEIYQEGFERDEKDVGNQRYFISAKHGGRSQLKQLRKSRGLKPALY